MSELTIVNTPCIIRLLRGKEGFFGSSQMHDKIGILWRGGYS